MNRNLLSGLLLVVGMLPISAQTLEDLNIQIHGYATQGFLYTTNNNILTTKSSDGSPAWDETVVNVTAQPTPKLRIGVQARYNLMGNLGNAITLDWASADYNVADSFGVRFGKVKTPSGLFNEMQDIDPGYIWALLPQSVYPIESRNSQLSHYGGVVYGTLKLGSKLGKLEYRGFGGERVVSADDGFFVNAREGGLNLPNGLSGPTYGAALHWRTPIRGLMIGASNFKETHWTAIITAAGGALKGVENNAPRNQPNIFGIYERGKVMIASEYCRQNGSATVDFAGMPTIPIRYDQREWYGMASYKLTSKLTVGLYDSQASNKQVAPGPARYSKDWAIATRYEFNQFLYAKAEQHFIDGTAVNFDATMNPSGLKPDTRLTVLKIGVSF